MWGLTFFISICTFQGTSRYPSPSTPFWCGTANVARLGALPRPLSRPNLYSFSEVLTLSLLYRCVGFAGFSPAHPVALWVLHFIWPVICVMAYVLAQLVLVVRTLQDRWPLGDIVLGMAAFVVAQVILFGFGNTICTAVSTSVLGGRALSTYCANRLSIT